MNILALAATTSRQSINARLLSHAADLLAADILPGAKISFLDLNDFEMPIYSVDREAASGIPEAAMRFHAAIGAADALLFAFAEHNGHFTAAYKNLFDWTSRVEKVGAMSNLYQGKPMVALGTSPGPGGAPLPLFAADLEGEQITEPAVHLREMTLGEAVIEDYVSMRLSLRAHPLALLRPLLTPPNSGGAPDDGPHPNRAGPPPTL